MHAAPAEVLYARSTHGSVPVRVVSPGRPPGVAGTFELLTARGDVAARYGSARSLIAALTGNKHHGLTFDRYFGIADPLNAVPEGGSVLDLFVPTTPAVVESKKLTVAPQAAVRARPVRQQAAVTVSLPGGLGIDLALRGHEVRKILFAGFGARIMRSGYDPDEVLQEVYRGILARNRGKCPFDVRKSSFGHYVHMVAECILNNYHRREQRRREVEQVGMPAPASMRDEGEGTSGQVDAASVADRLLVAPRDHWSSPEGDGMSEAIRRLGDHLRQKMNRGMVVDPLEPKVAELLVAGLGRREIAQAVGVSQGRVTAVITSLREHAMDWA